MNRALLVGINAYPSQPLSGCVNDVEDVARYLEDHRGFAADDIEMLLDQRATKRAIKQKLRELIASARRGDRLLFHYSGHGTQMPTAAADEPDGLDEVLCPVDFDWTDDTALKDDDLDELLRAMPAGASMTCVLDACHSGDSVRELKRSRVHRARFLAPPLDVARKLSRRRGGTRPRRGSDQRVVKLAACASNEVAADSVFDGRANGAFTYHLLQVLQHDGGEASSVRGLIASVGRQLVDYGMHPDMRGSSELLAAEFLQGTAAGGEVAPHAHDILCQLQQSTREHRSRLYDPGPLPEDMVRQLEQLCALDLCSSRVLDASAAPAKRALRSVPWGVQVESPHEEHGAISPNGVNGRRY